MKHTVSTGLRNNEYSKSRPRYTKAERRNGSNPFPPVLGFTVIGLLLFWIVLKLAAILLLTWGILSVATAGPTFGGIIAIVCGVVVILTKIKIRA